MSKVTELGVLTLFESETGLYTTKPEGSEFTFLLAGYNTLRKIANDLREAPEKHAPLRQYIINQTIHVDVRRAIGPILPEGDFIKSFYPSKYQGRKFRKTARNLVFDYSSANTEMAKVQPGSIESIMQRTGTDAQGLQRIRTSDWSRQHVGDNFYQTAENKDKFYASATLNACHIVGTDIWKILKDELNQVDPKKLELFSKTGKKEFVDEGTAMCFLGRQELHTWLSNNEKDAKSTLRNDLRKKIEPNKVLKNAIDIVYPRPSMEPLKRFAYKIIDQVLG